MCKFKLYKNFQCYKYFFKLFLPIKLYYLLDRNYTTLHISKANLYVLKEKLEAI